MDKENLDKEKLDKVNLDKDKLKKDVKSNTDEKQEKQEKQDKQEKEKKENIKDETFKIAYEINKNENSQIRKKIFKAFFKFLFYLIVLASIIIGLISLNIIALAHFFGLPAPLSKKLQSLLFKNKENITKEISKIEYDIKDYSKMSETIAKKVLPSVVGIEIEQKVSNGFNSGIQKASGTGVIISKDGYILTNGHVVSPESNSPFLEIEEKAKIRVKLSNDEQVDAKIVGIDKKTDLAVLKIDKNNLPCAKLGDSSKIQVGAFAMAIGNPLNLSGTITAGIISGINRDIKLSDGFSIKAIQTDAAINRGNSGGPLVNASGEVIGINTLKVASSGVEGIGFAIPINLAKSISEELIKNKEVKRPELGIAVSTIPPQIVKQYNIKAGVIIQKVFENGPAQKAGLKEKDIITKFDNKEIKTSEELIDLKNHKKINDEVELVIIRDNKEQKVKLKLEEAKENNKEKKENIKNIQSNKKKIQKKTLEDFNSIIDEMF